MKLFKSHFRFSKQERSGIFFLLAIIVCLQLGHYVYATLVDEKASNHFIVDKNVQAQINALKENAQRKDSTVLFPFNPNYITDYKGYTLGMSVSEIDRLHGFRASRKFVNSVQDFQKVTLVSDSLLHKISPYFKFPDWVNKKKYKEREASVSIPENTKAIESLVSDINLATASELRTVNGIGEKLSARIIKFRDRLGGFVDNEQVSEVYGLETAVLQRISEKFKVLSKPEIVKVNINTASASEISKLVYLNYTVSNEIIRYREENGTINSLDELKNIAGFPSEKINRISLYLAL
ncbi:helix-hairpin-helix domain-containing protein [Cellulophaga sp. L1A9]|uniref:ComEA family DNA-binding protein n=1 Tax=Cellulophaga sp. L1A9 TaxID=2686362 RepID=UPI00131A6616|nr:helix-hairpin-helix domain-containing protein [Cellulophaga sp. L1A9]